MAASCGTGQFYSHTPHPMQRSLRRLGCPSLTLLPVGRAHGRLLDDDRLVGQRAQLLADQARLAVGPGDAAAAVDVGAADHRTCASRRASSGSIAPVGQTFPHSAQDHSHDADPVVHLGREPSRRSALTNEGCSTFVGQTFMHCPQRLQSARSVVLAARAGGPDEPRVADTPAQARVAEEPHGEGGGAGAARRRAARECRAAWRAHGRTRSRRSGTRRRTRIRAGSASCRSRGSRRRPRRAGRPARTSRRRCRRLRRPLGRRRRDAPDLPEQRAERAQAATPQPRLEPRQRRGWPRRTRARRAASAYVSAWVKTMRPGERGGHGVHRAARGGERARARRRGVARAGRARVEQRRARYE